MLQSFAVKRIAIVLWVLTGSVLCIVWLLSQFEADVQQLYVWIVVALALNGVAFLLGLGLAVCYHRVWRTWKAWVVLIGFMMMSGIISQQPDIIDLGTIREVFGLIFVGMFATCLTALTLLLFRHDIGLKIAAWIVLSLLWGAVLWLKSSGNFLAFFMQALLMPGTPSPLFWVALYAVAGLCLLPIAFSSFLWHSAWLLYRELTYRVDNNREH